MINFIALNNSELKKDYNLLLKIAKKKYPNENSFHRKWTLMIHLWDDNTYELELWSHALFIKEIYRKHQNENKIEHITKTVDDIIYAKEEIKL